METEEPTPSTPATILAAALASFGEHGFTGASIEDIRRRSGASVGSIYHHFGGKEQIAAALYVEALAGYGAGFRRALARNPGAEEGVRAAVRHHLRWVAQQPELARFLADRREAEVAVASEDAVRDLNRAVFGATRSWHERHVRAGVVRDVPLDLLYSILLGPAQEFARQWLTGRASTSLRRAQTELADAAWAAIRTP